MSNNSNQGSLRAILHGHWPFPLLSLPSILSGSVAAITAIGGLVGGLAAAGIIGSTVTAPTTVFELEGFSNQMLPGALPPDNLTSDGESLTICASQSMYIWVRGDGIEPPVIFNGRLIPRSTPEQIRQIPLRQELATALMWWEFEPPLPPDEYTFELIQLGREAIGSWNLTVEC